MRERPILFSGAMVRAILDGRKCVTRRVVKPQPDLAIAPEEGFVHLDEAGFLFGRQRVLVGDPQSPEVDVEYEQFPVRCPYRPGDRLYVKEACWIWGRWTLNGLTKSGRQKWRFRADPEHRVRFDRPEQVARRASSQPGFDGLPGWVYRHARFMPRWASRITLDVVSVRVERVQEITPADAKAEGAPEFSGLPAYHERGALSYVDWFRVLWDSINAARGFGWDANPWVWCIEFRRVDAAPRREGDGR